MTQDSIRLRLQTVREKDPPLSQLLNLAAVLGGSFVLDTVQRVWPMLADEGAELAASDTRLLIPNTGGWGVYSNTANTTTLHVCRCGQYDSLVDSTKHGIAGPAPWRHTV